MKPLPLNSSEIKRRGMKPPFRKVVVLVMTERNGKPHIEVFGESIPMDAPIASLVNAFQSQTDVVPTIEINGKEWANDGE